MPTVAKDGMRGLAVFISDIRNCKSKEAETKRINKVCSNYFSPDLIFFERNSQISEASSKATRLSMVTTKRNTFVNCYSSSYLATMLILDTLKVCPHHFPFFTWNSAVNLLSSNKYTEKQIGYLFISVLLNDGNDLVNLIIQNIKNDLSSRNPIHVNLALHCIANVGTREMAEVRFCNQPLAKISF